MAPRIFSPALAELLPLARWLSPTDASSVEIVSWQVHFGSPATGMVGGFILGKKSWGVIIDPFLLVNRADSRRP
jgi:hypothetical protein